MDQEIPCGGQQRKKHDEVHNRLYAFSILLLLSRFPCFTGKSSIFLISDFQASYGNEHSHRLA